MILLIVMIRRLPHATQLLYSELLDELLHAALSKRGISFFTRTIDGRDYWYLQYVIGSSQQSYYLGPDDERTRARVEATRARWDHDDDSRESRMRLVSMLRAGGATVPTASHARVLEALAQAGVFAVGGVLVGSHAFAQLANTLGVVWEQATMRTKEFDIGHGHRVAVPDVRVDLEEALKTANKDFIPVPALNRKHPSTTFSLRNRDLSVTLLTPMHGKPDSSPRQVSALRAMAEPVRFLDYILEDVQPAAVTVRNGILVNVPAPARFALHKLVVSQRRAPAFETKAKKDVVQAQAVLDVLLEDRPGDILVAAEAAEKMPRKFISQLRAGLERVEETVRHGVLEIHSFS